MIAPDANLLIYAYNEQAVQHAAARGWLESVLGGTDAVGIPMLAVAAFLRVMTDTRFPGRTMLAAEAIAAVEAWLERPHVQVLHAGAQHWTILSRLIRDSRVAGPLLTDAQMAAIAIEYGATIHTADRDFDRFPQVRSVQPLRAGR